MLELDVVEESLFQPKNGILFSSFVMCQLYIGWVPLKFHTETTNQHYNAYPINTRGTKSWKTHYLAEFWNEQELRFLLSDIRSINSCPFPIEFKEN